MNIAMEFYKMPWYQMPATYQKYWICVIHDAQNGASLTLGPLGELDFQMASAVSVSSVQILSRNSFFNGRFLLLQFTRSIHRFTMLLVTMFK